MGTVGGVATLLVALASLIGGIGVARFKPWGRTAGYVAAIGNILGCVGLCVVSVGLGIWLLVLLANPDSAKLFRKSAGSA